MGLSVLAKNTAAAVPYLPRRGRAGLRNMAAHGEREDLRQMARHEDGCGSSLLLFLGVYRRGRRDLLIRARVVVLYSCLFLLHALEDLELHTLDVYFIKPCFIQ